MHLLVLRLHKIVFPFLYTYIIQYFLEKIKLGIF